jgi:hypothetical protein
MSNLAMSASKSHKIGFCTVYSNDEFLRWLDMAALGGLTKEAIGTTGFCENMVRPRSPSSKPLGAGSYTKRHNCQMRLEGLRGELDCYTLILLLMYGFILTFWVWMSYLYPISRHCLT